MRHLHRDDRGTSLTELVVGMLVMGVFMAIFTTTVVSLARTTTQIEAVTTSTAQVNNAFLRLDKLVRYASAITPAGRLANGDWHVELFFVDSVTAVATCTQLRTHVVTEQDALSGLRNPVDVGVQQLQLRTWTVLSPTAYEETSLTDWTPLASNLTNATAALGSADQPFSVPTPLAAATSRFQQLTITLVAGTSGPSSTSTSRTGITSTALNSSATDGSNDTKCQQALEGGLRP